MGEALHLGDSLRLDPRFGVVAALERHPFVESTHDGLPAFDIYGTHEIEFELSGVSPATFGRVCGAM
jgi:hypothetical protein